MNITTCVIVPIYKNYYDLTVDEIISLKQCLSVLGRYDICFVGPNNLNFDPYLNSKKKSCNSLFVQKFDLIYFDSVAGYNKLLLSQLFYTRFDQYKYILIYQLDAYVFRNELNIWCEKGFDYIGAPWINDDNVPIAGVGNGGFSLRNIEKSRLLLKDLRYAEVLDKYKRMSSLSIIFKFFLILYDLYLVRNKPSTFEKTFNYNEDFFWGVAAPERLKKISCKSKFLRLLATIFVKSNFKVAPAQLALKFSFETAPDILFKANNEQLPFGCHAWKKHNPDFWKPFIPVAL